MQCDNSPRCWLCRRKSSVSSAPNSTASTSDRHGWRENWWKFRVAWTRQRMMQNLWLFVSIQYHYFSPIFICGLSFYVFLCAAPRCSFSVNCKSTGKLTFPTISVGVKYHRLLLLHVLCFCWTTLECLEKTLKLFITCRRLDSHLTQLINHIKIHYKKISTHIIRGKRRCGILYAVWWYPIYWNSITPSVAGSEIWLRGKLNVNDAARAKRWYFIILSIDYTN